MLKTNCGVPLKIDRLTIFKWNSHHMTSFAEETGDNLLRSACSANYFRWIRLYPSAERIWLCIRLKYCIITLKILVMLQNVCENCVQILEEEKHRQLRMFVIL